MSKVLSVRVGDELAAQVRGIAEGRGVGAPTILKAALELYVEGHGDGGDPPVRALAAPRGPVRVDTVTDAQRWARERQARLNKAKERSK